MLQSPWLSDTISEIKCYDNNKFLENTLKFAKDNNILNEVFEAKIGGDKTLLEVAEEEGVKEKVEEVIRDAKIDDDKQQSTFWSRNKEKIAFGLVGSLLLAGCIVTVCTLGPPASVGAAIGVVAAAVIGAAMMLMSVLAITTDRGDEMWSSMLKDLCVSKPGPTGQQV